MDKVPCRDCGEMLDLSTRGCANCARNLDAERMIDKLLFGFLLIFLILVALALWLFFFSR